MNSLQGTTCTASIIFLTPKIVCLRLPPSPLRVTKDVPHDCKRKNAYNIHNADFQAILNLLLFSLLECLVVLQPFEKEFSKVDVLEGMHL